MKTIKHFLAATLLFGCLAGATAQSNFGEFKWGLKGGVNFAGVNNITDGIEIDKGRLGFVGGAFCKIPLKSFLSIRPELLFHMKGSTLDVPSDVAGLYDEFRFGLNYLEVPLSFDFDLPFFIDFHAGVQGAFLISQSLKFNGTKSSSSEDFNKTEFGWHLGSGIDLGNIGIQVRYQQSLAPFYDATLFGTGKFEPRNWGISLTASYMFIN